MNHRDESSYIEVESIGALVAHIEQVGHLRDVVVQGLDLTGDGAAEALLSVSAADAHFLGCLMTPPLQQHIRETGGTIFPVFEGLPFNPYRAALYTPEALMHGYERGRRESLADTTDGRIYAHFAEHHRPGVPMPILVSLAYRIHDHAIDNALHDLLYPADAPAKRVVGIMGGHSMRRNDEAFGRVARVAWHLTQRGYFIASGGGPGAMEAANLGAYMAAYDEAALEAALRTLATQPNYTDPRYFEQAYAVRDAYPDGRESLAIPTWFYGHEPTNLFSLHVAKYFANSLREDGLLAIAQHGVVYAPGSAGTVQEVFMDAAQNHYVTFGAISPMVFLDTEYWTHEKPVYPLLTALAADRAYARMLALCDEVEAAVRFIVEHEPIAA